MERGNNPVDRISQLPDEILALVLSRFTMREAAATSVISRRWEKLWTLNTALNFDDSKTLDEIELEHKLVETEKRRYVQWVNQVLDSHRGSAIDIFRVCFPLNKSFKCDIDRWLEMLMRKRVQRLELDLKQINDSSFKPSNFYAFPYELLIGTSLSSTGHFRPFEYLTDLCLKDVNVSGETLEYFLSSCPLERLCVEASSDLVNLKVTGPCLQLKYLEICYCWSLASVEIFMINLISFKYYGRQINLPLKNVPLLVNASIGGALLAERSGVIPYAFCQLACYLSQLESLTLDTDLTKENLFSSGIPELTNLKQLVLIVGAHCYHTLLGFTSLINASPYLHKFVLKLNLYDRWPKSNQRGVRKAPKCPHMHLKVVELIGFVGHTIDVELVEYILENAVVIEKITINSCHPIAIGTPYEFEESEMRQSARDCAMQLKSKIPQGAELVML